LPQTFNFAQDVVDRLADEDRAALIFIDDVGHRRDYSFREVSEQSQRYAAVLRAFGIEQGERVILRASNSAKFVFTMLALERLGAVRVPCIETCTADDVVDAASGSGASTILANRKYRAQIDRVRDRLSSVQRFIIVGEEHEGWARLDTLTSRAQPYAGLTTQSADSAFIAAGVSYAEQSLYAAAQDALERLALVPTDRFWSTLPLGSAAWVVNTLLSAWACGAAMVLHEGPFDPVERFELLSELEVTVLLQTADEYAAQISLEDAGRLRLPRLRRCLCAGDPPEAEVAQRWQEAVHIPIECVPSGVRSLKKT
jgi:acyl-coenzyme A synthetase/AMP-(fatty) acid ligase